MKRKKFVGIIVLLLMICAVTVGYSYLSENLNINGTSRINVSSWSVHFGTITPTAGSVTPTTAPAVDANGDINFSVVLNNPGEFYEFTVDVVNDGTINAAMSNLPVLTGVSAEQDVYTNFTYTHSDGTAIATAANEGLNAGTTKTYKVRVEYDADVEADDLPTTAQNMNLKVALDYEQA